MSVRRRAYPFCRHGLKVSNSTTPLRTFESSAHISPDYVLSPLIIELDAADSKYVRKFEDLSDYEKQGMFDPVGMYNNDKINVPSGSTKPVQSRHTENKGFNELVTTPPDVVSFALFGESEKRRLLPYLPAYSTKSSSIVRNLVYDINNVQPFNQTKHNAQNILYKFSRSPRATLCRAGFEVGSNTYSFNDTRLAKIKDRFASRQNQSFAKLQRITSMISQLQIGRIFLNECGSIIISTLTSRYGYQRMRTADGLGYLNDLCVSMTADGPEGRTSPIKIGRELCYGGLFFASKAFNLPAGRFYLKIACDESYEMASEGGCQAMASMNFLCAALANGTYPDYQIRWNAWRTDDWRRTDLLMLLTGWKSDGVPTTHEIRQPCFASLLGSDDRNYMLYIGSLGLIGASDALWHEWESIMTANSERFRTKTPLEKAEIFLIAFQLAKDVKRVWLVKNTVDDSSSPEPLFASGAQKILNMGKEVDDSIEGVLRQLQTELSRARKIQKHRKGEMNNTAIEIPSIAKCRNFLGETRWGKDMNGMVSKVLKKLRIKEGDRFRLEDTTATPRSAVDAS